MNKFLTLINVRTLIVLLICVGASFLTVYYNLKLHQNFILFGLLIVFPLVKSFQFAFRRREWSLEYLSSFRASLTAIHLFLQHSKKLSEEQRASGRNLIKQASDALLNYLKRGQPEVKEVYAAQDEVSKFLLIHEEEISGRNTSLIIRQLKDAHTSTTYLISLTRHRTVFALRMFALIFISLFPLLQAPLLNHTFGKFPILVYLFSCITGLVLITLYNVQHQLENPFDQIGYDDVHLDDFKVDI